MRIITIVFIFSVSYFLSFSQTSEAVKQNISNDSSVVYRLFATKNIYTFIKLNTRNGKMWQMQWGLDSKYRHETVLSERSLVYEENEYNGRFFIYPTTNVYNFLLIDQKNGSVWQVQWGDKNERMVTPIF